MRKELIGNMLDSKENIKSLEEELERKNEIIEKGKS